jgi:hypothetical protein
MKILRCNRCFKAASIFVALWGLAGCAQTSSPHKPVPITGATEGKAVVAFVRGQAESTTGTAAKSDGWTELFDGKSLKGWTVTDFAGTGKVEVQNGQIMLHSGLILTGVNRTNALPKTNYEVALEAMKVEGSDFFCCLTFPVGDSHCSFANNYI